MFYILILIFSGAYAKAHPVVNGTEGSPNEFRFMVSIRNSRNRHFCGGGIIDEQHVISAYHCLEGNYLTKIKVVAGTYSLKEADPDYTFSIVKVYRFNNKRWLRAIGNVHDDRHDVAIFRLDRKIPMSDRVQIVDLPDSPIEIGTPITFAGWGETYHTASRPYIIQKLTTIIRAPHLCARVARVIGFFPPYEMCAFATRTQGLCGGDSGSPLVLDGVLVGISLWGDDDCATGLPDYFASVYHYADFIRRHLKEYDLIYNSSDKEPEVIEITNFLDCK